MEMSIVQKAWDKSKLLLKGIVIGVLALFLMIPSMSVQNLVEEREQRQKEAVAEVSSKWATAQNISGPVLVLPYIEAVNNGSQKFAKHFAYILPDRLNINATVQPQERSRGIYKVILYNAQVKMKGGFGGTSIDRLKIPASSILWNEAFVKINLSDPKGLNNELTLQWNDTSLALSPQMNEVPYTGEGLIATLPNFAEHHLRSVQFSTEFNLNGSESILFTPVGGITLVNLDARWPHPSFTGNTLPQTWSGDNKGFKATWKSFSHKRDFPQQWKDKPFTTQALGREVDGTSYKIGSSAFGANLFIPINGYQKTMRSVKYAILCILLTFAAIFLMDVIYRKSIHPFQYGLVGAALILFYVLLLSFSEYIGFNWSYAVAAIATIGLIGWFLTGVLHSGRLSIILSAVLVLVYSYVFTILQLQDYSLLIGSIGLFVTLAIIMHFSRKINW
jgi:inner membrane protein